jgi:hypothetical protein
MRASAGVGCSGLVTCGTRRVRAAAGQGCTTGPARACSALGGARRLDLASRQRHRRMTGQYRCAVAEDDEQQIEALPGGRPAPKNITLGSVQVGTGAHQPQNHLHLPAGHRSATAERATRGRSGNSAWLLHRPRVTPDRHLERRSTTQGQDGGSGRSASRARQAEPYTRVDYRAAAAVSRSRRAGGGPPP